MQGQTAILIFANSSQVDLGRKGMLGDKGLFNTLNAHTLSIVKSTKLPYFQFTEHEQVGNSFGERFTNAIKWVYAKGFDNVITIGNDTPHLTAKTLLNTHRLLENNTCVLGPSTDGGFYLMGLHKSQFNEGLFTKLPWQSSKLSKSITLLLSAFKVEVIRLETLQDIDAEEDIKNVLRFSRSLNKHILNLLRSLIPYVTQIFSTKNLQISHFHSYSFYNKGSPFGLSI
ncbi:TIGR04282 family arsenosugar biosynthesis glycosyltransferase [Croceibacter atlanticus]|jgi:hypothetical protein|uniref:TIGR04282 family arsenosugar biosynthesis glycosyltransferase n=1 Tax=Croceibacter atlanticus TaxID=313588 RepID=UPI0030D6DAD7|tara:strand:- start:285442 stop:286125 length:684 start_codon:yes stop_codon:yes gene_type:complete